MQPSNPAAAPFQLTMLPYTPQQKCARVTLFVVALLLVILGSCMLAEALKVSTGWGVGCVGGGIILFIAFRSVKQKIQNPIPTYDKMDHGFQSNNLDMFVGYYFRYKDGEAGKSENDSPVYQTQSNQERSEKVEEVRKLFDQYSKEPNFEFCVRLIFRESGKNVQKEFVYRNGDNITSPWEGVE